MKSTYLKWAAFFFALFHIYCNVFASISELWLSAIHFGGFCAICALMNNEAQELSNRSISYWINIALAGTAILTSAYLILFEDALYARETEYILSDYVFSMIAIGLAIEFTRRTTGWFMPVLIILSLSYILFLGRYISGVFSFPGLSLETVLYRSFFTSEGMFGLTAQISSTFVFMFIIFGSFLLKSGAGDFIVQVAQCLTRRITGGAGLVSVIGSGLMGSISGSAVANTVSIGVITIPMMKRSGFSARFAAGVEAAASTGGALMPPVMGAGAFVLASYTQIPYLTVIAASALPALLYFLTVSYFVRIEAKRLGMTPVVEENAEKVSDVLKEGWHFIIPLTVLVGFLIAGRTPTSSAAFAIISVIAASWLSTKPMRLTDIFDAVVGGVKTMVSTALLLVAVGIIINVVTTTGLGNAFSLMIVEWAQGNLLVTLILVALASLVLGMGLPVTASYIVLATLSAPMIFDLISQSQLLSALQTQDIPSNVAATISLFGGDPVVALQEMPLEMKQLIRQEMIEPEMLTGMLLSAHLIIFWLSQDSNVTPPVCLASFAAAGIAGTKPMATGLTSWKVAKGLYLVPVLFAYSPLISG
nr:TRAP transporter fused permease subunit [Gammaproteobacteria bacterium]